MYLESNRLVKPYFSFAFKANNVFKSYGSPLVLIPTIAITPWHKQARNSKRYGDGRFEWIGQLMIWFLIWELSISVDRKNYRYT